MLRPVPRQCVLSRGGVAEWLNALVLKTSVPQGTEGSNPSPSAMLALLAGCLPVFMLPGQVEACEAWGITTPGIAGKPV